MHYKNNKIKINISIYAIKIVKNALAEVRFLSIL